MSAGFIDVVETAILEWPATLRLCLIIVVAATMLLCVDPWVLPALPGFMR